MSEDQPPAPPVEALPLALACVPWALAGAVAFGLAPAVATLTARAGNVPPWVPLGACELGVIAGASVRVAAHLAGRRRRRLALLVRAAPVLAALVIGAQVIWLEELTARVDPAGALAWVTARLVAGTWADLCNLAAALVGLGLGASGLCALHDEFAARRAGSTGPVERAISLALWGGLVTFVLGVVVYGAGAALGNLVLSALGPSGAASLLAAPFVAVGVTGTTLGAGSLFVFPFLTVGFQLAERGEARLAARAARAEP